MSSGSRIALGLADKPTLDRVHEGTDDNRIGALLHDAGAADLAERWVRLVDGPGPDLSHWGYPDEWLEDDVDLAVGARTLRAVATPGHTRGHYVFAEPDAGLLFAGDHVLPTITPSIGFEPVPASLPLGDFLSSLTKVRAMPDALLLPAHGPVAPSVHARVDELLAHHDERLAQCRQALAPGGRSAYDVAARLTWTRHEHPLADLDTFNQTLAVLETRAHLELLVARGDAVAVDTADGRAYAPVSPGLTITRTAVRCPIVVRRPSSPGGSAGLPRCGRGRPRARSPTRACTSAEPRSGERSSSAVRLAEHAADHLDLRRGRGRRGR